MPLSSVVGASSILKPGVCTSSTRPAAPFEGQTIYETDTDQLLTYNGSGWKPFADVTASTNSGVLQVVQTTKTDTFSTASTSYTDVTGLTVTITPSSTSSKVLLIANISSSGGVSAGDKAIFRFNGGNSSSFVGASAGSRRQAFGQGWLIDSVGEYLSNVVVSAAYLDSPNTTSSTTYAVQMLSVQGTNYVNRTYTDTDANTTIRFASSILAMEISG